MKTVLTIAGSDCSGGAGIQADLATFAAHGCYGMSVVTALTAQNTMGVQAIEAPPAHFVLEEIRSVFTDIRPSSVKIGMTMNQEIISAIASGLEEFHAEDIVLDPVMVSTSGCNLIAPEAQDILMKRLMPLARIITPNIPEAEVLCGHRIGCISEMENAAREIASHFPGTAVLVKGGHLTDTADDLLLDENGALHWLKGTRIDTKNTHGTGCTLSSAIASNLALGLGLPEAVRRAKSYVTGALQHDPHIGHGNGPLNHLWNLVVCKH